MFKTSGRGSRKPFCINESCKSFLPEDKRGYKKKKDKSGEDEAPGDSQKTAEKAPAGKSALKKTAAKKKFTGKSTQKKTKSPPKKASGVGS